MKLKTLIVALLLMAGVSAQAQGLGGLLNGLGGSGKGSGDLGNTIGNVISGIFTKSDLTLEDIVGEYVSDGPAVSFKSDNFLQKAGGLAGAAALETKLKPYFEQYGLTGMPLVINQDGTFSLTIKGVKLGGTVAAKDNQGEFTFKLTALGAVKVGQFKAYIQKSGNNIDLMFDAKKLKDLISTVGKFTGQKLIGTFSKVLDSYEGCNIGFSMKYTGAPSDTTSGGSVQSADTTSNSGKQGNAVEGLFNILNSRKK